MLDTTQIIDIEKIKEWMKSHDIDQTELAYRMGHTEGHVSMLLKGKRGFSLETIFKMVDVLGATLNDVLSDDYLKYLK